MAGPKSLVTNDGKMLWVDLEMSGLNLSKDVILEIACIATNADLDYLDEGISHIVKTDKTVLDGMGEWCREQHGKTGLTAACLDAPDSMAQVEDRVLAYTNKHFPEPKALLAGNSVHVDKKWLEKDMPRFHDRLHYRICDVSSIKELVARWYPDAHGARKKAQVGNSEEAEHRALADIKCSIEELKWYRENVFKPAS